MLQLGIEITRRRAARARQTLTFFHSSRLRRSGEKAKIARIDAALEAEFYGAPRLVSGI